MKKALIFVLALVLMVGVFAACGDKEEPTTAGKPAVTTTAPKGGETTTAPKGNQTTVTTEGETTTEEVIETTEAYTKVDGIERDPAAAGEYTGEGFEGPLDPNPNDD